MIPEDELELGELPLLEVDNRIVLPVNVHIRVIGLARNHRTTCVRQSSG